MSAKHEETLLDALRQNLHVLGELAVRYKVELRPERSDDAPALCSPQAVQRLLGPEMGALAQEQVRVLLLDRRNRVVAQRVLYQGHSYESIGRPAEVLRPAVVAAVPHIIVAHNHPSSDPTPSPQDIAITRELAEAATLLGVTLLDHVVIGGPDGAVSLKDRGLF